MRKNIWIINHYGEPPTVGKYTRHYKFASELIKRGYNVRIFTSSAIHRTNINYINNKSEYLEQEIEGVPFVFVKTCNYEGTGKNRVINMFQYATRVLKVTKKFEKPDVIYASSPHPLTWLAGYKIAKRCNAKFIAETRDMWPETLVAMEAISENSIPARILYKIEKYIYKNADRLIFTMSGGKDYIKDKSWENQIDLNKVNHINNGIDLEEYNKNIIMYQINDSDVLNDEVFKVMYAGALGEANMVITILEAAKELQYIGIEDIKFLIYGSGYLEEKLKEYIQENNLKNVYFKGKVEKKYVPYILSRGQLNIIVGKDSYLYKYGFSQNKFFDYLASGKPIISNRDCHKILDELKCGLTVEGESPEALAEGILKFYSMPKEEYDIYCKNASEIAQDYDFKVLTDKLEGVILED